MLAGAVAIGLLARAAFDRRVVKGKNPPSSRRVLKGRFEQRITCGFGLARLSGRWYRLH